MAPTREIAQENEDFAVLKPRVAYLSQNTLKEKYKKLSYLQHAASRDLIRDVAQRSRGKSGRAKLDSASDACLHELTTRLIEKLPRIPFPPKTDELYFDHESNIRRVGRLEEQLNNTVHSATLLRAQIERERRLLKEEQSECTQLETSLKSNEAFRKEQLRSLHHLARSMGQGSGTLDILDLDQRSRCTPVSGLNAVQSSDELAPVLETLATHLISIESNGRGMMQISAALDKLLQHIESCDFPT